MMANKRSSDWRKVLQVVGGEQVLGAHQPLLIVLTHDPNSALVGPLTDIVFVDTFSDVRNHILG